MVMLAVPCECSLLAHSNASSPSWLNSLVLGLVLYMVEVFCIPYMNKPGANVKCIKYINIK